VRLKLFLSLSSLEVFDAFDPIFEVDKGPGVYHQFCREILEAFFAHAHHIELCEIFEITGTFKAKGILVLAEYNRIGASFSHMFTDNPNGNLSMFRACFFFRHNTSCFTNSFIVAEPEDLFPFVELYNTNYPTMEGSQTRYS
jgi:hypothetical protein